MPIFYQQDIDESTRLAIWKIEEEESFFLQHVPLQREITHPHKRLQHLAGRYLLQYLFPDFPISLIKIADTRKPFLEDEAYHFSISHCSDYAAAIVSRTHRVGVDIEVPTSKVEKIKLKFLHENELKWFGGFDVKDAAGLLTREHINLLTTLWSAKETVFKWWSFGDVDFSEMIRIDPFELNHHGVTDAAFISVHKTYPLKLYYHFFEGLCLTWTKN